MGRRGALLRFFVSAPGAAGEQNGHGQGDQQQLFHAKDFLSLYTIQAEPTTASP